MQDLYSKPAGEVGQYCESLDGSLDGQKPHSIGRQATIECVGNKTPREQGRTMSTMKHRTYRICRADSTSVLGIIVLERQRLLWFRRTPPRGIIKLYGGPIDPNHHTSSESH